MDSPKIMSQSFRADAEAFLPRMLVLIDAHEKRLAEETARRRGPENPKLSPTTVYPPGSPGFVFRINRERAAEIDPLADLGGRLSRAQHMYNAIQFMLSMPETATFEEVDRTLVTLGDYENQYSAEGGGIHPPADWPEYDLVRQFVTRHKPEIDQFYLALTREHLDVIVEVRRPTTMTGRGRLP